MIINLCVISTKTGLGSLFEAVDEINKELESVIVPKVFYTHQLDERNKDLIREFKDSVLDADIVIIDIRTPTSWFVKELPELLRRSRARVVLPLVVGSPEILRYLKLNGTTGDAIFSRIREVDMDTQYLEMSKIWRIMDLIEKSGRIIPVGPLKHFRNWALCIKYWAFHGKRNLKNMLLLILKEYFRVKVKYEKPLVEIPPGSIWDPEVGTFKNINEYLEASRVDLTRPTIAILLYAGMHFDQCKPVAEYMFKELKSRGVNVIPIIGGSSRELCNQVDFLRRNCMLQGKPVVDAIVNLQWFRINGGPYGGPSEPTYDLLKELDCPLFNGPIMFMREVSKWEKDEKGVSPIEVVTAVTLPEIDGAIEPIPIAGLSDDMSKRTLIIEDRINRKINRILGWLNLRRKPNAEKRVAIVIYNYPPGEHNVGSASYLDVFGSLEALLKTLKENNYVTDVLTREDLKELITTHGLVNSPQWTLPESTNAIKLDVREYSELLAKLPDEVVSRIVETWGEAPGNINVVHDQFLIPGVILGNVFIGVQPSRGVHENTDKIYHSKDLPPHHQYLAFYYWISEVFKADAVIHLGTHGTLEFMPGKEVGLSAKCFPDTLIGDLPHVYVYHVTNPSEMTIAKRRSYAYTITHGTPPYMKADLYEDYVELEELLHEFEEARVQDPSRASIVEKLIEEKCEKLNIAYSSIDELHDKLFEMKRSIAPRGLHVLGEKWSDEDIVEYLTFVLRYDREVKSLNRVIAESKGLNYDDLLEKPHIIVQGRRGSEILEEIEREAREIVIKVLDGRDGEVVKMFPGEFRRDIESIIEFAKDLANRIRSSNELASVINALDGKYIQPIVAGDPIRTPEAFPTGSHGYAFDPRLIPSKAAYIRGRKIAEETLKKYREKHGKYPETVGVVLWGFETMGTRGETVGQILHYLGVRLVRKHGPWSTDLEVIPLEELGRPRVDVVVTICGIFRDTLPHLITLIDRAVKLVANLNEPPEMNYVRKHVLEMEDTYGENSTIRIFGPKDGAYNTRLTDMIESSAWRSEEELADTYIEDMMYGYGESIHAKEFNELFRNLLNTVDLVSQVRYAHEYEITDLDHYYEFLGGLRKAVENTRGSKVDTIWIDTTLERIKFRDIDEAIDHAVRTRLLNPKWINAMIEHGYDGVREIAERVEYVLGLAATTGEVSNWVWNKIADKYVFNDELRNKMLKENKWAVHEIVKRLYEAYLREYWKPREEDIEKLREVSSEIEGYLEE